MVMVVAYRYLFQAKQHVYSVSRCVDAINIIVYIHFLVRSQTKVRNMEHNPSKC
jgi:hypothetical protein